MFKKYFGSKEFENKAIKIALPVMFQGVISNLINLLDNVMVGQFGKFALSGVSSANRYYMVASFGMSGLLGAASVFLAQFLGADDKKHMKQSFRYMVLFSSILIVPVVLFGFLFPELVIAFFTDDASTIAIGSVYLRAVIISFIPHTISSCISSAMRAVGETTIPMIISVATIVVNIICDFSLMFGFGPIPALGLVGSAYGTFIARILEVILFLVVLLYKKLPFAIKPWSLFKIEFNLIKNITVKAFPLLLNEILWASGMAALFKFYATRGPDVMAGYAIAGTVSDIFFTWFGGMAVAITVLVAQNLGANKIDKAKENGYHMIGLSLKMAVLFAIIMFTSAFIMPHLYDVDIETKQLATNFIQIMSCFYFLYVINCACYFILRAGGEMKLTMIFDSVFMWVVNIPVVAIMAYLTNFNIYVLYIVGQATDIPKLILAYVLVKKETWLNNLTEMDA